MATERNVILERPRAAARRREPMSRAAVAVVLGAGLCALYGPVLKDMVATWWTSENASHGFLVPIAAGYLAWGCRGSAAAAARRARWAVVIVAAGLLLYPAGVLSAVEFLPQVSLLVVLGGLMLYFLGGRGSRLLAFPYAFLWFAVPWPDTLVEVLGFPMQLFSAKFAAMVTGLAGVPVMRDGVDIHLPRYTFSVGAPCSGMKSLVALLAVGALAAYLLRGPAWKRWVLFAASLPLALMANVVRILCILAIGSIWGREAAQGFLHGFAGMVVVYITASVGLAGIGRWLGLRYGAQPEVAHEPALGREGAPGDIPGLGLTPRAGVAGRWWGVYAPLFVLLGATWGLVVACRAAAERTGEPVRIDLGQVPMRLEGWGGKDLGPLDRTSQEMLHPDGYLARLYSRKDGYPVDIVVVAGREKETFHSPGFCLLGGGWSIIEKGRRMVEVGSGRRRLEVNQFVLQRQGQRRVVLYWYASHGEGTRSWVALQYRLLRNRLLKRPLGGALIRVSAPVAGTEEEAAEAAEQLVRDLYPSLLRATGL